MFQLSWSLFAVQFSLSLLLITSPIVDSQLHQHKDSLRNALDVLARKQRSLDASSQQSQNYYNPLRAITYPDESIIDDDNDEEDLDFISMNNPDQLDDINGNNYQRINDMKLVLDSLQNLKGHLKTEPQRDNEQSLFRERERIGNYKRDTEHLNGENYNHEDLAQLFMDAFHNSAPYNGDNIDDIDDYPGVRMMPANDLSIEMFQPSIHDKYKNDPRDKINIDDARRSLAELLPLNSRQMAMEHYPINREYENNIKRFPVAKRNGNTKKLNDIKSQENTDPKTAQDLKSLFETRTLTKENLTPQSQNHDDHKIEHNHIQTNVGNLKHVESSTGYPSGGTSTRSNGNQNEIESTNIVASLNNNSNDEAKLKKNKIKKSVDWSQYFGIDRRRKKAEFLARPGTQKQDDDWLLKQYYTIISDNILKNHYLSELNSENKTRNDGNGSEKRDKLEQIDEKLKNVKNLIMKDAAKYCTSDNDSKVNSQEVKDAVMARLAAAVALEKMRRALNDFKNSIVLENSATMSQKLEKYRDDNSNNRGINQDKRNNLNIDGRQTGQFYDDISDLESTECPGLLEIEMSCRPFQRHPDYSLFVPCVMYKICKLCNPKSPCTTDFLIDAFNICEGNSDGIYSPELQKKCTQHAIMMLRMPLPHITSETAICYDGGLINSCHRHYQQYNRPMPYYNTNDNVNKDLDLISDQRWK